MTGHAVGFILGQKVLHLKDFPEKSDSYHGLQKLTQRDREAETSGRLSHRTKTPLGSSVGRARRVCTQRNDVTFLQATHTYVCKQRVRVSWCPNKDHEPAFN